MRTTIVLLALAVLAVAVLAACRPRDESASDSAPPDSAPPADDTVGPSAALPSDTAPASATRQDSPRAPRAARATGDSARDSTLPPDDSIRAMRPDVPQVTPPKRPRTWRGFKLPEEMPVRTPVDTIRQLQSAPDSVMKGDSTKPPTPDR
jgi:hypothetical protein